MTRLIITVISGTNGSCNERFSETAIPQVGLLVAKIEPGVFKEIPPDCYKESDGIEDKYRFMRHIEQLEKIIIRPRYVRE